YIKNGRKMNGPKVIPTIRNKSNRCGVQFSTAKMKGYSPVIVLMIIAQYSFAMKTESVTQGLWRLKLRWVMLDACPFIAGVFV
ncbi:hypothetical protein, partial [Pseudomonas cremoricolorata]|uniref:hypothetical protein n=1 Tax=Pseudomonas cremoricolorata TaxID=157783 RepID=UPI001B7FCE34